MILIDLSQTLFSVIFQNQKEGIDKNLARHSIFMTLLSYKKQFETKYGSPVLAVDSKVGYWRRDIFEHYKAHRKKDRESRTDIDWSKFYDIVNTVTEEIRECLPWKTVYVDKAEADDIIAVLAMKYGNEPTLIVSSDKDYKQLQYKKGVAQFSPILKKWLTTNDPKKDLDELIILGDP
jgi:5'-3' exonuclease